VYFCPANRAITSSVISGTNGVCAFFLGGTLTERFCANAGDLRDCDDVYFNDFLVDFTTSYVGRQPKRSEPAALCSIHIGARDNWVKRSWHLFRAVVQDLGGPGVQPHTQKY